MFITSGPTILLKAKATTSENRVNIPLTYLIFQQDHFPQLYSYCDISQYVHVCTFNSNCLTFVLE